MRGLRMFVPAYRQSSGLTLADTVAGHDFTIASGNGAWATGGFAFNGNGGAACNMNLRQLGLLRTDVTFCGVWSYTVSGCSYIAQDGDGSNLFELQQAAGANCDEDYGNFATNRSSTASLAAL